jgi:hypothetical protein
VTDPSTVRPIHVWRLPLLLAAAAWLLSLALVVEAPTLGSLAVALLVAPIFGITLVILGAIAAFRRLWVKLGAALVVLVGLVLGCGALARYNAEVRAEVRWTVGARALKADVMAQPLSTNGLRYVVWDGWGMFGMDTDVYLVFSPDDELGSYSPNHLVGLPCPVSKVQRLERHWYSVIFYTDTGWVDPPTVDHSCG